MIILSNRMCRNSLDDIMIDDDFVDLTPKMQSIKEQ